MRYSLYILFVALFFACDKSPEGNPEPEFSLEDEKRLSELMLEEIFDDPGTYGEIIDPDEEAFVYTYIERVKDSILAKGRIEGVNTYPWNIFVVNDSFDASAYGLPGGQLFISSGLILYMFGEDELASVMGREMAYIDQGLAIQKILEVYGAPLVIETFSDTNRTNLPAMVDIMRSSSYSIENEELGDKNSVRSLCNLSYTSDALANLYLRNLADSSRIMTKNFVLLPLDTARINTIRQEAVSLGCSGNQNYLNAFQVLKDSLRN
jgi:predicted Zn-dependent protease